MKRYPYSYRHVLYNEGGFYEFLPLARKPVAPGERLNSLEIRTRFLSAVFDKANVTPMLAQAWAFYIPNRIVWDQWVDFVALDPAVTSVPMTTVPWNQLYEPSAGAPGVNVFPRRGFKLTYNQYFGEESTGQTAGAWYDNPLDDSVVTMRRLLAWDQFRASTKSVTYTQGTYVAAVSGASATIQLDDLQRSLDANRATRRQRVTGDKYVDTMRLFGVELDWKVQLAPEFLGTAQVIIQPKEKASSQAQDAAGVNLLYKRASEYTGSLSLKVGGKAFAEHGYILAMIGFRPAFLGAANPTDTSFDVPSDYFRPETGNVVEYELNRLRERNAGYLRGSNLIGLNNNGNIFVNPSANYPANTPYVPITGSGPNQMAFGAEVHYRGLTPIRPGVA